MNYRHDFHAGNPADVLKHLNLLGVLRALSKKDAPYVYIDTHAGAGGYDLEGVEARKTSEFHAGIGKLWVLRKKTGMPPLCADYLNWVTRANTPERLKFYPGSPAFAQALARTNDRLVLIERQPDVVERLKATLGGDARVAIHQRDGYEALKALLPPRDIKRGVVLVDPPYENHAEFMHAADALIHAARRWSSGIYLLWYPITAGGEDIAMLERLRASGIRKILVAEWCWHPCRIPGGMNGSGMVMVNPPWQFDVEFAENLAWVHRHTVGDPSMGRVDVRWLVPE